MSNPNETNDLNTFTLTLRSPMPEIIDYGNVINKPTINDVEIVGSLTLEDLGIASNTEAPTVPLSYQDIDDIIDSVNQDIDN